MTAKDLTLNIAVNLGRISRWVAEGKTSRIKQFLKETEDYLAKLEQTPKNKKFERTFKLFKKNFQTLKTRNRFDDKWAEDALTWANILTHRAKLA